MNKQQKQIEIIEEALEKAYKTYKDIPANQFIFDDYKRRIKDLKRGYANAQKEVLEKIEFVDVLNLCTKLKDRKTGKEFEVPEDIQIILDHYWVYIKEHLIKEIKGASNTPKTKVGGK